MTGIRSKLALASAAVAVTLAVGLASPGQASATLGPDNLVACIEAQLSTLIYHTPPNVDCMTAGLLPGA